MSTDNSVDTVQSYKDNRIHIIKNKRKRYNGGSRNVGIEYALENFDIMPPQKLTIDCKLSPFYLSLDLFQL